MSQTYSTTNLKTNHTTSLILVIIRFAVGLLFIFSGLIKANDPLGLSYKMQEFFEVWGMQSFNDFTLFLSLSMNTFEIVAGVAVILGWRMRLFSWLLLLLIIFFTFLTGYALFSGKIKTCGCFGNCIPLTAQQSFIKDIILLVLIVIIFIYRGRIKPFLASAANGLIILASILFCFILQWYVLKHLPIIDCLPYKKGNNIVEKMKIPEGAVADSFAIMFRYTKAGKELEFDMDHFPVDFNDTTYQYVDRVQKLVRQGNATAAINDFALRSMAGNDTTMAILNQGNMYVMVFLKNISDARKGWEQHIADVARVCEQKKIPIYVVSAVAGLAGEQLQDIKNLQYLQCDATVIKTAARETPSYLIMKQANILDKFADADYKNVITSLDRLSSTQ